MRVLVTGQVGLDKKQYLEEVAAIAAARGEAGTGGAGGAGDGRGLKIYHIGDMMYREAPDVPAGRILDLPLSRLNSLRRAVFRDVLAEVNGENPPRHAIVNTHATFRWKHGLFAAFDFDQLALFNADLYVVLVDNIETVHARLLRDHDLEHSLKDLMVWREEEILATEILAKAPLPATLGGAGQAAPRFLVLARGREGANGAWGGASTAETLFRLIFRPGMKKVYPSFPMSHVADLPGTLAEINDFRAKIAEHFIAFDPGDVDEKLLADAAIRAAQEGKAALVIPHPAPKGVAGGGAPRERQTLSLKLSDLLTILPDIDGQIYARDFMLVRQADMIISYIPELPGGGGKPGLSSGVERELQHAYDHGRDVYVIWKPRKEPSPFITQTANRVFRSIEEAMQFFEAKGYLQPHSLFG